MWLFREQGNFSSSMNLDVLDVGYRDQGKFSGSVNLEVLDVALKSERKVFKLCELGCARCGFSETKESLQVL